MIEQKYSTDELRIRIANAMVIDVQANPNRYDLERRADWSDEVFELVWAGAMNQRMAEIARMYNDSELAGEFMSAAALARSQAFRKHAEGTC